jgi:hypothetical protein
MEFLQGIQYFFINDCDSFYNYFLTEIAYILVILQPLIWNIFFYFNTINNESSLFSTAIWFCILWIIVNILSRILYNTNYSNSQTKETSIHASNRVCTKQVSSKSHLYWEWTSANFYDLNANYLQYLMLWFIPALISSKFRLISIILIISALISLFIANHMTSLKNELFIIPSLWCYFSAPIVLVVILSLLYNK